MPATPDKHYSRPGTARLIRRCALLLAVLPALLANTKCNSLSELLNSSDDPPAAANVEDWTEELKQENPDLEFGNDFQNAWLAIAGFGGSQGQGMVFGQLGQPNLDLIKPDFGNQSGLGVQRLSLEATFQVGAITDVEGDGDLDIYGAGPAIDGTGLAGQFYKNDPDDSANQFSTPGAVELSGLSTGLELRGVSFTDTDGDGINDNGVLITRSTDTTSTPGLGLLEYNAGGVSVEAFWDFDDADSIENRVQAEPGWGAGVDSGGSGASTVQGSGPAPGLALSLEWLDEVRVLPNDGSGGFPDPDTVSDANRYAVGDRPVAIASGDLDGQLDPDLVVANFGSDDLSVLLANGDGTFAPELRVPGGVAPEDLGLADFDNDGDIDVLVAAAGEVVFHANDGTGMLAGPVTLATYEAVTPREVYPRDFNGDGNIDVSVRFSSGRDIDFLFGAGDGSVGQPQAVASAADVVTTGDLDGDASRDLAFARTGGGSLEGVVAVRFNDGHGVFGPEVVVNTDDFQDVPTAVAVAELTGDSEPDVVVADNRASISTGGVAVYPNNGDGTFGGSLVTNGDQGGARALAIGDLDGAGVTDAAAMTGAVTTGLFVATLLNNGDGSFTVDDEIQINTDFHNSAIALGDLDGDGHNDIVAAQETASEPVNILFNDGSGGFLDPPVTPAIDPDGNAEAKDVVVFDLDGDGDRDILVSAVNAIGACVDTISDALIVLRNDGSGAFDAPEIICGGTGGEIALADHEKAGISIFLSRATPGFGNGFAVVTRKDGGSFLVPQATLRLPATGIISAIAADDIDRDGFAEVIAGGDAIVISQTLPRGVVFFDGFEGN